MACGSVNSKPGPTRNNDTVEEIEAKLLVKSETSIIVGSGNIDECTPTSSEMHHLVSNTLSREINKPK